MSTDRKVVLTSARFQGLLAGPLISNGFAKENQDFIDNRRLYGNNDDDMRTVLELFFRVRFSQEELDFFLPFLLETGALEDPNVLKFDFYAQVCAFKDIQRAKISFMLNHQDRFPIRSNTLNVITNGLFELDADRLHFIRRVMKVVIERPDVYEICNQFTDAGSNPLENLTIKGDWNSLTFLFEFIPIVDLDYWSESAQKWISAERSELPESAERLIRAARRELESYRQERAAEIEKRFPPGICFLINQFGQRPRA